MKINDPKSLVFVDNIDNEVGVIEVLASIKYVDSAIERSWNKTHKNDYTLQEGDGIFIEAPTHKQIVSIKYDELNSEPYLYINNFGIGVSGISTTISTTKSELLERIEPIENKLSGINSVKNAKEVRPSSTGV